MKTIAALFCLVLAVALCDEWDPLTKILDETIQSEIWPGCAAAIFTKDKVLYRVVRGKYTYGIPPPYNPGQNPEITFNTLFDMASCTKVLAGTSAMALLYQRGAYDLDAPVSTYIPGFEANGKEKVTVRNILLHNSGLPADPAIGYSSKTFDCPETRKADPQRSFSCRDKCYHQLLNEGLRSAPGSEYVYSDMGFMTVMNIVGHIVKANGYIQPSEIHPDCPLDTDGWAQCYYEAFVRKYVFKALGAKYSGYLPAASLRPSCAPTENETNSYRHRTIQGEVHDENAFAMGGVSGHAGLFATLDEAVSVARNWLFPTDSWLNASTVKTFTTQYNHSQSSRALGWNTNTDDAPDQGWDHACGTLSPTTFMHIGFTGPMVCDDPVRKMGLVLLDNRVYPDRSKASENSKARKKFATKAQEIFDSIYSH